MKSKTIKIKNNKGNEYILEYTRETVAILEKQGFDSSKIQSSPMTMLPLLFRCAFLKNHRSIRESEITELYDSLKNKDKLIPALVEMVSDCYNSLLEDNENNEGNVDWEIV